VVLPAVAWHLKVHALPWSFGIWAGSGKYTSFKDLVDARLWKTLSERTLFLVASWSALLLLTVGLTRFRESAVVRLGACWLCGILTFMLFTMKITSSSCSSFIFRRMASSIARRSVLPGAGVLAVSPFAKASLKSAGPA